MERASGSADCPSQFWATFWAIHGRRNPAPDYNWEITEGAEWVLAVEEIPEATHLDFGLHKEYCFTRLSPYNLAIHELVHGSVKWELEERGSDSDQYSQSTNEVVVKGEPIMPGSRQGAYCHCGKCDWIWFLRGWECWPVPYIVDIG